MAVISVIGAPGVGKSFLTKQLACAGCSPAFFEGEAGIFSAKVLSVLNSPVDSIARYDWLSSRYKKNLERAQKISRSEIDCYVDGDILSMEAWLEAEIGKASPPKLSKWIRDNHDLKADLVIILYMEEDKLIESIKSRGRQSEQNNFIIERALRIQKACIRLGKERKNTILINRTRIDFTHEKTLEGLQARIAGILKKSRVVKKAKQKNKAPKFL